jgi:hypothetical protein
MLPLAFKILRSLLQTVFFLYFPLFTSADTENVSLGCHKTDFLTYQKTHEKKFYSEHPYIQTHFPISQLTTAQLIEKKQAAQKWIDAQDQLLNLQYLLSTHSKKFPQLSQGLSIKSEHLIYTQKKAGIHPLNIHPFPLQLPKQELSNYLITQFQGQNYTTSNIRYELLTITQPQNFQKSKLLQWTYGQDDQHKKKEDAQWLRLYHNRRTLRLSGAKRQQNFFHTQLSYHDFQQAPQNHFETYLLLEEKNLVVLFRKPTQDFEKTLPIASLIFLKPSCTDLNISNKKPHVFFPAYLFQFDLQKKLPLKSLFFHQYQSLQLFKDIDIKWFSPSIVEVKNIQNEKTSYWRAEQIMSPSNFSPNYFSPQQLND